MKLLKLILILMFIFLVEGVVFAKETQNVTPADAIKKSIENVRETIENLEPYTDDEPITEMQQKDESIDANTLDENGNLLVVVYQSKNKLGLKKTDGTIITKAIYKKLVRLGDKSWIVQYKTKFGLIDYYGNYIILPKYRNVQRIANKFVKFGNDNDYGLYDEYGFTIIQPEYSSIDLMKDNLFLTRKNFRYGLMDLNGNTVLENEFDDIYMSGPNTMMVQYQGNWCQIENFSGNELSYIDDITKIDEEKDLKMTDIVVNTGVGASYSVVTLTDYLLRLVASISPAYEATIDELMYSQGADTISILMKLSWIPKFPIVYIKQYYRQLRNPNAGPLASTRTNLKKHMK